MLTCIYTIFNTLNRGELKNGYYYAIEVYVYTIEEAFVSHYLMISDLLYILFVFTFVFVLIQYSNLHIHKF